MYILGPWLALAAVTSLAVEQIQHVAAHSVQRNPLRHVSRVEDAVLHTHQVHAHSTFELSFYLRDDADKRSRVRLSLEPNDDILPHGATISYIEEDGTIQYETVNRLDHRVFKGDAFIQEPGSTEWSHAGWARIMLHHDGGHPLFEGGFHVDGDHHHIQSSRNYRQTQVRGDPILEEEIEGMMASDDYMVVWKDSDIRGNNGLTINYHDDLGFGDPEELRRRAMPVEATCHSDRLDFNAEEDHPVYQAMMAREEIAQQSRWQAMSPRALFGRQNMDSPTAGSGAGANLAGSIGSTRGCPTTRKVALVGIATDCTYGQQFPGRQNITNNVIQQMNLVSKLYEDSFNITLGLQNLTIQPNNCPARNNPDSATPWNLDCNSATITDRLNLFSRWRGQTQDTNAFWTLLTTCPTDSAVGLAWLGQVCVQGSQQNPNSNSNETISSANVVVRTSTEWQVIAHEIGHTFGAVHDCVRTSCTDGTVTRQQCCPLTAQTCDAGGEFIMNPSTGSRIQRFSACSIGNICSAIGRVSSVRTTCLRDNREVPNLISGSQCGNGIVEAGEQCDCGGANGCQNNPCCDGATCRFRANAVCDFANEDCCTRQCTFAPATTVCRAGNGQCDPQETCPGTAARCPDDVTADDGIACGDSGAGLTCASGQCTSRDLQCKVMMGARTTNNDTYSCGSQGCQLSCSSPQFGSNTCLTMMQYFRDGTPCDGGGKCSNGRCQGATFANEVGTWIRENQAIFIPVVVVVGVLFLLAIITCCVSRCRRKRGGNKRPRNKRVPKPSTAAIATWGNHPDAGRGNGNQPTGWLPPLPPPRGAARGGPQQPPPMYGAPPRSMSMRYA